MSTASCKDTDEPHAVVQSLLYQMSCQGPLRGQGSRPELVSYQRHELSVSLTRKRSHRGRLVRIRIRRYSYFSSDTIIRYLDKYSSGVWCCPSFLFTSELSESQLQGVCFVIEVYYNSAATLEVIAIIIQYTVVYRRYNPLRLHFTT